MASPSSEPTTTAIPVLLSLSEAARLMKQSADWLYYRAVQKREIDFLRLRVPGSKRARIYFCEPAVLAWLEAQTTRAIPQTSAEAPARRGEPTVDEECAMWNIAREDAFL